MLAQTEHHDMGLLRHRSKPKDFAGLRTSGLGIATRTSHKHASERQAHVLGVSSRAPAT